MKLAKVVSIGALLLAISSVPAVLLLDLSFADSANWSIVSTIIMFSVLLSFYFRFEGQKISSKDLAIIATMGALAAAGRVPFVAVPSLQPTTFLVIITGYVFGVQSGFMVGATSALVSNFLLGQGPWTPWQMLAWGLAGATAGLLSKVTVFNRWKLAVFAAVWGLMFGWLMNIYTWTTFVYPLDWQSFWATQLTSLPMDIIHAVGNFMFTVVLGKQFINVLQRFKKKMRVEYIENLDGVGESGSVNTMKWKVIKGGEMNAEI